MTPSWIILSSNLPILQIKKKKTQQQQQKIHLRPGIKISLWQNGVYNSSLQISHSLLYILCDGI